MKKFVRILCLALVAVTLCATLASCGKVSGAYKAELDIGLAKTSTTYEFGSFGKVTVTMEGEVLGQSKTRTYEGKYEIIENDDDTMDIKFSFEDENDDTKSVQGTYDFEIDKENDTIKIGLVTYKKVD